MSRIEDQSVTGWRNEHDGAGRPPRRERVPELSSKIVGGLGVLLLSPTVLTAASRSQLEAGSDTSGVTDTSSGSGTSPRPSPSPSPRPRPDATAVSAAPRAPGDGRMRIAVIASGLAAISALVYTAPGTPWNRSELTAAQARMANVNLDMAHDATVFSEIIRTPDQTTVIDVSPATVGVNTIAITVLSAKGVPAKVEEWSATASLPGESDLTVALKSLSDSDGVGAADVEVPVAGDWTFTITTRVAGAEPTSITQVIPIAP